MEDLIRKSILNSNIVRKLAEKLEREKNESFRLSFVIVRI